MSVFCESSIHSELHTAVSAAIVSATAKYTVNRVKNNYFIMVDTAFNWFSRIKILNEAVNGLKKTGFN